MKKYLAAGAFALLLTTGGAFAQTTSSDTTTSTTAPVVVVPLPSTQSTTCLLYTSPWNRATVTLS